MDMVKQAGLDVRFNFVTDMNADGVFTISDMWEWFKWAYFAPGDLAAILLMNTSFGNFLEINHDSLSGGNSGVFSFIVWLFLWAWAAIALEGR